MHTPAVEDYLKAIWMLQQSETPVGTSRIADRLGLSAASVTSMIKRLAEQKMLHHEPYYGVRLTAAGELSALRVVRRHRVLELFLTEVLGYRWDCVHEEAERLEHAVSDELIERLEQLLGTPRRDPHGSAIPTANGELEWAEHPTLAEIASGERVRVVEVRTRESEQLRYLGSLDLFPGAYVEVVEHAPGSDVMSIRVNDAPRVITCPVAAFIGVSPDNAIVSRPPPDQPERLGSQPATGGAGVPTSMNAQ